MDKIIVMDDLLWRTHSWRIIHGNNIKNLFYNFISGDKDADWFGSVLEENRARDWKYQRKWERHCFIHENDETVQWGHSTAAGSNHIHDILVWNLWYATGWRHAQDQSCHNLARHLSNIFCDISFVITHRKLWINKHQSISKIVINIMMQKELPACLCNPKLDQMYFISYNAVCGCIMYIWVGYLLCLSVFHLSCRRWMWSLQLCIERCYCSKSIINRYLTTLRICSMLHPVAGITSRLKCHWQNRDWDQGFKKSLRESPR